MNVAILRGRLSSPPRHQELRSGDVLVALEVTTDNEADKKASVPVAWFTDVEPPEWDAGQELVIVGIVRRRFFSPGVGKTASRTEVVADTVLVADRTREVARRVDKAVAALTELAHPTPVRRSPSGRGRRKAGPDGADHSPPKPSNGRTRRPAAPDDGTDRSAPEQPSGRRRSTAAAPDAGNGHGPPDPPAGRSRTAGRGRSSRA
jgi:hypothetical protein